MASPLALRDHSRVSVTIVVPIYDHWSSLEQCINSLVEHVDLSRHKILLVNDCGPHADTIEALVLFTIGGRDGIEYHRNESNLGFVGTCNRAVLELDQTGNDILLLNSDAQLTAGVLDELLEVLYAAEQHGIVCPRSNNATIATLPYFRRGGGEPAALSERSRAHLVEQVSPMLPRYYVSPVAVGFCFLVKRILVDNYGLFDPIYGRGYNEENDFCMRVNAVGYSSLIANRAYVPHLGSASFTEGDHYALEARNSLVLAERYPFYGSAVENFISYGYAAADVFAELIAGDPTEKKSVLVDVHHLSSVYNGSTRYALAFLRMLDEFATASNVTVTVAAQSSAIDFFALRGYGVPVVRYDEVVGVYDVGIALAPLNHIDQLVQLNDHCARWVVTHFDVIALRSWNLNLLDPLRSFVVERGLAYADRILAISESSIEDASRYFPHLSTRLAERAESIPLGSTRGEVVAEGGDRVVASPLDPDLSRLLSTGGYIVVMGNFYPHKQVAMAIKALSVLGHPLVAFGPLPEQASSGATVVLSSGTLSEAQMEEVFQNAALVVFPSAYEGFGLPIAESIDFGVPVIVFDTTVAREVVKKLELSRAVRFFSKFDELPQVVLEAISDAALHGEALSLLGRVRGLEPYNRGLWDAAMAALSAPIDLPSLHARFTTIKGFQQVNQERVL